MSPGQGIGSRLGGMWSDRVRNDVGRRFSFGRVRNDEDAGRGEVIEATALQPLQPECIFCHAIWSRDWGQGMVSGGKGVRGVGWSRCGLEKDGESGAKVRSDRRLHLRPRSISSAMSLDQGICYGSVTVGKGLGLEVTGGLLCTEQGANDGGDEEIGPACTTDRDRPSVSVPRFAFVTPSG